MARTKVSKLVRIEQDNMILEFSLAARGKITVAMTSPSIQTKQGDTTTYIFTIGKIGVKELLGLISESTPGPKLATSLPTEPLPARKEHRTEEGLKETEGGKGAEGMG